MTEQTYNGIGNNISSFANELRLLEAVGAESETSQADLAAQIGVAVGTVNWYLKRWSKKGYIKVQRINRWKWEYLLTPEGIKRKAVLASQYLEASMSLYRRTRVEAKRYIEQVQSAGYEQVSIDDSSELADICRLTCLELGMEIVQVEDSDVQVPTFRADGFSLELVWPEGTLK